MDQEITKELAKKLMEIEGETRGVVLKTDGEYVLKEKGEEGLKKIEEELEKLGYPIKYGEIKTMEFYPVGLRAISLLVVKKAFNFNDEKIKEIGIFATKVSLIIKIFTRYFLSVKRVFFIEAPKIWRKHWTKGDLIPVELNEEKKYAILRLQNFSLHPIYCTYLGGYFCGVLLMLLRATKMNPEETKCVFRGDEYHEFLIKWQ